MTSIKDPNPIYDPGSPRSTAGINSAAYLCDMLEITLSIMAPQEDITHGWGQEGLGAEQVVGTWELNIQDRIGNSCSLVFDILPGNSPIIIGLDIGKHAIQNNASTTPFIQFQRPTDTSPRAFNTYITADIGREYCERIRIVIAPRPHKEITALVSSALLHKARRDPKAFAKRIHHLTHANPEQIKNVCDQAGILNPALDQAIQKVSEACDICASTGRPATSNKISLTHVNEAFNMEVQADFAFEVVRGVKRTIFIITDTGTTFSEGTITALKDISTTCKMLENL